MKIVGTGIIVDNGKILIAQRPKGKSLPDYWEFPGGKLEEGETIQECLKRELWEELGTEAEIGEFIMESDYKYEHGEFALQVFWVHLPKNAELKMNVHQQLKWVTVAELPSYQMPPADIHIVEKLQKVKLPA